MKSKIGIRRENKGPWERRAPIVPEDVKKMIDNKFEILVQSSDIRIFSDEEYVKNGAVIVDDLLDADVIVGIKEVKEKYLIKDKIYIFFSHTIKAQEYNMHMLSDILEKKITLIDYELIKNEKGMRLIFFGRFAGLAGAIDSLWVLGRRLKSECIKNPFENIKRAWEYSNLEEAKNDISKAGEEILERGIPDCIAPFVAGFVGYGNVSLGAQEIFSLLPVKEISATDLLSFDFSKENNRFIYKVIFHENEMVEPLEDGYQFELQDYYDHPEKYRGIFEKYLDKLSIVINGTYWDEKYPRHITKKMIKDLYSSGNRKLKVIGDISCDINGGVEMTEKITSSDNPVFVWDFSSGKIVDGYKGNGPVVLAVDILPSELPVESSEAFSHVLLKLLPEILQTDFNVPFDELKASDKIKHSIIAHRGELTEDYKYLKNHL